MKKKIVSILSVLSMVIVSCQPSDTKVDEPVSTPSDPVVDNITNLTVSPNNILNDIASKPFGINMNTLTDDGNNRLAGAIPLSDAIVSIGAKYLRYPGGEKSDVYMWASAPFESPETSSLSRIGVNDFPAGFPEFWNLAQGSWANDNYNFDEFMTDCIAVGGEPVIVVALDGIYKPAFEGGTSLTRETALQMAVKWVEYANITKGYNVKYWSLGNETWNNDSYGGSNPGFSQYGIDAALFAAAMKEVDPSIQIGINGSNLQEFTDALVHCAPWVDFLDIHTYPCFGFSTYGDYERGDLELNGIISAAQVAIENLSSADSERIGIAMTEISAYGYQDGAWDTGANLGQSLANFELLATLATDERIDFTQFWNTRWINNNSSTPQPTDAFTGRNELNANGMVLSLLHNNVYDKMVAATSTAKVKVFASLNSTTGELVVFLLNKSRQPIAINLEIEDYNANSVVSNFVYTGNSTQDVNSSIMDKPDLEIQNDTLNLDLDSISITVLKLKKA